MQTGQNTKPIVDATYYLSDFHGMNISEQDFPGFEFRAEAYINRITFGRLKNLKVIPNEVKNAICEVCDVLARQSELQKQMISSENTDGYSVTYSSPMKERECQREMYSKAKLWLSGTGLLYKGRSAQYDH